MIDIRIYEKNVTVYRKSARKFYVTALQEVLPPILTKEFMTVNVHPVSNDMLVSLAGAMILSVVCEIE